MKKTKVISLSKTFFVSIFVLNFIFSPASFVFAEESADSVKTEKVEVVKEETTKEEVKEEVKEEKEETTKEESEIKEEISEETTDTEEVTSEEVVNDEAGEVVENTEAGDSSEGEVAGDSENREEESLVSGVDYITICHVTASQSNPYLVLEVDPNGWNGHDGHDGDFIITDLNNDQVIDKTDCDLAKDPKDPTPGVCIPGNLVSNGGFEYPVISGNWDTVPSGTAGLEWSVDWAGDYAGAPLPANMEIQNSGLWTPYEGNQYIELDSDWGYANQEEAGTRISQEINTVPGVEYTVRFAVSARPGTPIGQNGVQLILDDVNWGDPVWVEGTGKTDTDWHVFERTFTAVKNTTIISFEYAYDVNEGGAIDTLGSLLDGISVDCQEDTDPEPTCDALYARLVFADSSIGARNWGTGDVTKNVYVGSDSNVYADGEWFMIHDGNDFINDSDISGYRDVPGVAVQRMDGSLRVVLYGFHDNSVDVNKEAAQASIELSRDMSTRLTNAWDKGNDFIDPIDNDPHTGTRIHDVDVNDSENPMDSRGNFNGYIHQNNARFDNVSIKNDLFRFRLVVTTASDGFYADYNYETDDNCEPVDNPPVITVDPEVINVTVGTVVDILSGVAADDTEDGDITVYIVTGGDVVDTNTVGTYVVTYDVQDSDGNDAIQKTRTINVTENGGCNDCGGGDDEIPVITVDPENVYVVVGGSYDILNGVTADDAEDGDITVDITSTGSVDFNTVGSYVIYYDVQDSDGNDAVQKSRTIYVEEDDDNGSGGGISSGTRVGGGSSGGQVLGATTGPGCPHFTQYVRIGATGSEVVKIQEFLNAHMDAGLTVDGVFGKSTFKAVNDFQAKYYEDVIVPWKLSPNTTGYWYKSTRMMANYIVGCIEDPLLLEDPQVTWSPNNYGQNVRDIFALEGDLLNNIAGAFTSAN